MTSNQFNTENTRTATANRETKLNCFEMGKVANATKVDKNRWVAKVKRK